MIRPAWTPATIGLMVLGFVMFWPLGLAMLAYILWGDRLEEFRANFRGGAGKAASCNWGRSGFGGYHSVPLCVIPGSFVKSARQSRVAGLRKR